ERLREAEADAQLIESARKRARGKQRDRQRGEEQRNSQSWTHERSSARVCAVSAGECKWLVGRRVLADQASRHTDGQRYPRRATCVRSRAHCTRTTEPVQPTTVSALILSF